MGRRFVVLFWVAACVVLFVGQVPFAVSVGAQASGDVEVGSVADWEFGSVGEVPGIASEPLADPVVPDRAGSEVVEPLVLDPDASLGDELVERRSRFTRAFERSDGFVGVEVSPEPVAWDTGDGFELVDTTVQRGEGGGLEALGNEFQVRFGASDVGVSITLGSGRELVSRVAGLDGVVPSRVVEPTVDDKDESVVWYRQVFPGVDLRYTIRASGVGEDVVYTRAPLGVGAVSFDVAGAELASVWSVPAKEVPGEIADASLPAAELVGAPSLVLGEEIGSGGGGVDGAREFAESVRRVVDAQRPVGARSSLRAAGDLSSEVSFGELAVLSAGGSEWVADDVASPLARSVVTGRDMSRVEYSLDPGWLSGLGEEAFPVVLDPSVELVTAYGYRGYFKNPGFECGSSSPWCWIQTGNPWVSGYTTSYWRTVIGFDLGSVKSSYGLGGAGSDRVVEAALGIARQAGSTASTSIGARVPTAWSFAGAVGGASLDVDSDASSWVLDSAAVLAHVRSSVSSGPGVAFGLFSDTVSSYNHKESSVALWLTIDPSPPAPSISASAPADGKLWFAATPSSGPMLAVGAVSDANYKSPVTAMNYHFKVAAAPFGTTDYWGGVASRGSTTSRTFAVPAIALKDGKTYWWRAWTNNGYGLTPGPLYSFRYDRRLGTAHASPMQAFGPVSVNAATGNGVFTWSSQQVATVGGGAGVTFAHNTATGDTVGAVDAAPGMPAGWTASWGEVPVSSLDVTAGGSAVLRFTDGSKESFVWSGGRWRPDEALQFSTLASTGDTAKPYRWESPTGWVVNFDAQGRVKDATSPTDDLQPAALSYTWGTAGTDTVLRQITDPAIPAGARQMTFNYGGDAGGVCPTGPPSGSAVAPSGKLCQVTHMDGSIVVLWWTTDGKQISRIVEDVNGDLGSGSDDQSVTDLVWAPGPLGARITAVRSPQSNRLIAAGPSLGGFVVSDPGHTLDVTYDSAGRIDVLTGERPDATHVRPQIDFDFPSATSTTVTDANRSEPAGFTTRFTLDARGRATQIEDRRGRSVYTRYKDLDTDQVLWTDTESRDAASQQSWLRAGTVYDDRGRPVESWGPADRTEFGATSPSTGAATGGANTPMTSTTYDGGLQGFAMQYWNNAGLVGQPATHGYVPATVQTTTGTPHPAISNSDGWSARATGSVRFPSVGIYKLRSYSWGPTRLSVHDQHVDSFALGDPGGGNYLTAEVTINVTAAMLNKWYPVQLDTADTNGTGGFDFKWLPPGGAWGRVPYANVRPEFGLPTRTDTRVDTLGTTDSTAISYDDPTTGSVNETYLGIARATTVDPDGLALTTTETFEAAGAGYLRRTSRTLPSGAGSTVTYEHYDPTDGPIAAVCGVSSGTDQLGFTKRTTQADPDGAGGDDPIVREYVYDSAGRQVGYRASADVSSEPWTCTSFDDAGRVDEVAYPAWEGQPARTVSHDYAVGGDPTVTSVTDPAGTITATTDWAGRVIEYQDVWGLTTTTGYDDLSRVASSSNAGGTLGYSYGNDDEVTQMTFGGDVIAVPSYDSLTRMTGVAYPTGTGKAGNGTAGLFSYDNKGRPATVGWTDSSAALLTSDSVTSRDLTDRIVGQSTDGFDPNGATANYLYDRAGRLTDAFGFAEAPASTAAAHEYEYDYGSNGCGTATAGDNGNRVAKTVDSGTPITYCYDHADRLTATSDPAAAAVNMGSGTLDYDDHGNTSVLDGEEHVYDIADRHIATEAVASGGGSQPGDVVVVVGDKTNLTGLDTAIKSRLQGDGWTVTFETDDDVDTATDDGADLIFVAESSDTTNMNEAPLAASTVPLISAEVFAFDELGMTGPNAWSDHGPQASQTQIDVTTAGAAHDLGAGNTAGAVTILSAADEIGWGKPASSATVAASIAGDSSKATVFGYDTNDTMTTGAAPARRVGLWMYRVSDNVINSAGWEFFDAAVGWAASIGAGGGSSVPTVNYTRDATDRIVARTATDETETRYAHTGDSDSPQVTLDANNQVISTSISLPGGAVLHHTPGTPAPTAGDAVLVVGDDQNLTGLDTAIKSRLEGDGWTVTLEDDNDVDAATDDGADLIFVAESTDTGNMNEAPLAASNVPLVSAEVFAFDELGMTGSGWGTDHGPQANQTQIAVTAAGASHDLGAGNTAGAVTILTAADEIGWGKPASSATVAATVAGDSSKATVFGFDTNDTMTTGTAPARRVGLWMYRVSDTVINTAGWEFFDAAINWAANLTGGTTSSTNKWSYPNLGGSIAAQTDHTGTKTAGTFVYTPDGVPAAGGLPDTRPGNMDDTWLGAHKRPLEHAAGLQPIIEMGARQYHPVLARFLEVDPIEGGVLNDYGYVADALNGADYEGRSAVGACAFASVGFLWNVSGQLCFWKDHRGRELYTWSGGTGMGISADVGSTPIMRSSVRNVSHLKGWSACFDIAARVGTGGCAWTRRGRTETIEYLSGSVGAFPASFSAEAVYTSEAPRWLRSALGWLFNDLRNTVVK